MHIHTNITVSGKVQGVDYRTTAREQARNLGVAGFAKNMTNGSVYIEAEGEEAALQDFITWCKTGTPWSKVEKVEVEEGEMRDFKEFTVERSFWN
jgi:acylphosphatase